jgi:hypothetical protein
MPNTSHSDAPLTVHWWDLMAAPRFCATQAAARIKSGWRLYRLPVGYCSAGAAGSYTHLLAGPAGSLGQITTRALAQVVQASGAPLVRFASPVLLLEVPFEEKDAAKLLGAKWHPTLRRWCARVSEADRFARWLPAPPQIVDITAELIGT